MKRAGSKNTPNYGETDGVSAISFNRLHVQAATRGKPSQNFTGSVLLTFTRVGRVHIQLGNNARSLLINQNCCHKRMS